MGISAFPQGSLERERPPRGRGVNVKFGMKFDSPPRGAPAPLKGGVAPSIFSPLVCHAVCRTRGLGAARRGAHRGK